MQNDFNFRNRLSSSTELPEVEQKDIQVRLQELFRDKKNILDGGLRRIEASKFEMNFFCNVKLLLL